MVAMNKQFIDACPTKPSALRESFEAECRGDWTKALVAQERVNATSGLDFDACMRLAWLHYQAGGYRRAREYYEIATLFSEHSEAPLLGAMDCCVAMGDLDAASGYISSIRFAKPEGDKLQKVNQSSVI